MLELKSESGARGSRASETTTDCHGTWNIGLEPRTLLLGLALAVSLSPALAAQDAAPAQTNSPAAVDASAPTAPESVPAATASARRDDNEINFFELLVKGGGFMIPLLF